MVWNGCAVSCDRMSWVYVVVSVYGLCRFGLFHKIVSFSFVRGVSLYMFRVLVAHVGCRCSFLTTAILNDFIHVYFYWKCVSFAAIGCDNVISASYYGVSGCVFVVVMFCCFCLCRVSLVVPSLQDLRAGTMVERFTARMHVLVEKKIRGMHMFVHNFGFARWISLGFCQFRVKTSKSDMARALETRKLIEDGKWWEQGRVRATKIACF